eukprot:CAMPEP_0167768674 /NCGR_PEP_ID=MMETSP0110_2-20121227/16816_1 /TAXON_ID=629695 /ORGANISM="Gymnochlora sp., Strain CCMP2014" /LENGTH=114 /DNA_ID=CAMNT_0007657409 /DNA_START=681 /DNA_END=1025 /DNA_ORIENTATION=+
MATRLYHTSPSQRKMLVLPDTSDHNTFNLYSDILRPVASFIRTHCRASAREVGWAKLIASKSSEREKQKLDAKAFGAFELESVIISLIECGSDQSIFGNIIIISVRSSSTFQNF